MNSWQQTDLFLNLIARDSDTSNAIQRTLDECVPDVEAILRSGGTSPTRFTLHDADHSFRVAQMMASLAGESFMRSCSDFEAGMLLLSAYLHDIGMTPERNVAKRHWDYLVTGNKDLLDSQEQNELQLWLDSELAGQGTSIRCRNLDLRRHRGNGSDIFVLLST
jgi:hypothetical protein